MSLFAGLIAFPPTPADTEGRVDVAGLATLVDRLATAKVDAVGVLGSTGSYAYLDLIQRSRAVAAAIEAAAGRVPIIVGVGALRTSWACQLAVEAERQGADGILMAPISYIPLTEDEVAWHYRTVARATALPMCVYNNPGTTHFTFSDQLIADLASVPTITAIKMPPAANRAYQGEMLRLRGQTPPDFQVGYSGDWEAADALLAGASAWYSVVAGVLPEPALRLTRAAQVGDAPTARMIDRAFAPLWALFQKYGSIRVLHAIADQLSLPVAAPPLPVRPAQDVMDQISEALQYVNTLTDLGSP
ncbi:MAG: dihydrodipicolinate synthase family protein [Oxalobacteraceae bacterium]|nr:MAG: dihydrodipicolinate synthase family protein [Oxalobacteraceae bacterium]